MNSDGSNIPALRKPKCMGSAEKTREFSYLPLIANGNKNEALELLDPQNMEFSHLVELLHPKFVSEYLERILKFLTESSKEMSFPEIAPYKAAFLERIVTDPNNLKSDCYNESSKSTASKIINVLENFKNIFKWTFAYENGKEIKSVLVYRKEYTTKIPLETLTRDSSPVKLSRKDYVPVDFKRIWLSKTLQFTKDDSKLTLEYPNMSKQYADFISILVSGPTKEVTRELKRFCAPIWEAMRIFCLKYEFRLTSKKIDSDTVSLVLEKIPKKSDAKKNETSPIVETSDSQKALFLKPADRLIAVGSPRPQTDPIVSPRDEPKPPQPTAKKADVKIQKLIDSQPTQFLARVLKEFADFLEDQQQASLLFQKATIQESEFLQRLFSLVKSPSTLGLFPDEHRVCLRRISSYLNKKSALTIDTKLEKMNKKTRQRDVTLQKIIKHGPFRTLGPPKQLPLESPDGGLQALVKQPTNCPLPSPKQIAAKKLNPFLKALSVSSEDLASDRTNNEKSSSDDREPSIKTQPSRPSSVTKSIITTKTSTDQADQSIQSGQSSNRSSSRDGLSKAKLKMLEALSVPVQCDKAERMMMLMGWQGGALGARGEGITEPILPALKIKAGAGLGHVAPAKPSQPVKPESVKVSTGFRMTFMINVRQLIKSENEELTMEYDQPLTKNQLTFVTGFIRSCNKRKYFGLGVKDEIDLVRSIVDELCGTPVAFVVNEKSDKRAITVTRKLREELTLKKLKIKKKSKKVEQNVPYNDPEQRGKDIKITIELLKRILVFVKSDFKRFVINIREIHPEPSFYKDFFDNLVAAANKSDQIVYKSLVDYELMKAVVDEMDGFCLEVKFEDDEIQKVTLSKKHRKRFINSALGGSTQTTDTDKTTVIDFAIDNDDTDEGTSLSEDKSCQSHNNDDKTDIEKECDNLDTEKNYDNHEEVVKKDLKVEIYEDDWLNCCDSVPTSARSCDNKNCTKEPETNNNYVIKNYKTKPNRSDSKFVTVNEEVDFKIVHILPSDYPKEKVDNELAIKIQNALIVKLKGEVSLPKLRCLGIQNDALVYSCRNENTYLFLTDFIEKSDLNIKLLNFPPIIPVSYKVEFKINSLLQIGISETLVNFELYNNGLKTDEWVVLEEVANENSLVTKVTVDSSSYKYICDKNCSLDLGFDTALFRLVW